MKTIIKKIAAVTASAILTISTASSLFVSADSKPGDTALTLSFSYAGEGITCSDEESLSEVLLESGESFILPQTSLKSETDFFCGWTYDDFFLYLPGDNFIMPNEDTVLRPVWTTKDDAAASYTVSYNIVIDGEKIEDDAYSEFKLVPGQFFSPSALSLQRSGYVHIGWLYDNHEIKNFDRVIMPEHDVVLEPDWRKYHTVAYSAGDVDRINGNSFYAYNDRYVGNEFDIADSTRISRSGFNLVGWTCDYDGLQYKPGAYFTMPDADVEFTAIWEAKNYNVVFKTSNGTKSEVSKVAGYTDTAVVCPDCTLKKAGYVFAGWTFGDDPTIYKPGDEFIIPGALPGLGISLNGVWLTQEEYDIINSVNSFTLAQARQKYVSGLLTAEELQAISDTVLNKQ